MSEQRGKHGELRLGRQLEPDPGQLASQGKNFEYCSK